MTTIQLIMVTIVAMEHFYFLILEMFLWTTKKGIKTFDLESKEFADKTKVLAANQGLYNGFLGAGLVFSQFTEDINTTLFFLSCIVIAGLYGAYSTKKIKLFYIQSVPAILTGLLLIIY